MGKIAEQLQQALVSKANIRDELQSKGMDPSTKFESYYTFIRTMSGGSIEYYIWVRTTDESKGHIRGSGMYKLGDITTIRAEAEEGYTFDHWSSASGKIDSDNPVLEVTVEGADIIEAHFKEIEHETYQISAICKPAIGGTINGGGSYPEGASITLQATPTNDNYRFYNWTSNVAGSAIHASTTNPYEGFEVKQAETITANWSILTKVASNYENRGSIQIDKEYVEFGKSAKITATAKSGFTFAQWAEDGNKNATRTITVNEPKTYTALFGILITFNAAGGDNVDPKSYTGTLPVTAATLKLPTPTKSGYSFSGWKLDDGTMVTDSTQFESNTTLTAVWKEPTKYYYGVYDVSTPAAIANIPKELSAMKYTTEQSTSDAVATVNKSMYIGVCPVGMSAQLEYEALGQTMVKDLSEPSSAYIERYANLANLINDASSKQCIVKVLYSSGAAGYNNPKIKFV